MTHPETNRSEIENSRDGAARRGRGKRKHGPRGETERRGKGGPKRALKRGDLRYLILDLIKDTPRHGYEMMGEIETLSKGAYKPSPGVMYPALELMQDMGLAKVSVLDDKKSYAITAAGKTALTEDAARIAGIYTRLEQISQPKSEGEKRPLRMALDGLRHDVKSYMRGHDVSEENREKLAAIINKAREEVAALAIDATQK